MVRKHTIGDLSFHQSTLNDVIKRFSKFESINNVVVHYVPPPILTSQVLILRL